MSNEKKVHKFTEDDWHYKMQAFTIGESNISTRYLCYYFWTSIFCLAIGFWLVLPFKGPYLLVRNLLRAIYKPIYWYYEKKFVNWCENMNAEQYYLTNCYSEYYRRHLDAPLRLYNFTYLDENNRYEKPYLYYIIKQGWVNISPGTSWYDWKPGESYTKHKALYAEGQDIYEVKLKEQRELENKLETEREEKQAARKAKYATFFATIERFENKIIDKLDEHYQKSKQHKIWYNAPSKSILGSLGADMAADAVELRKKKAKVVEKPKKPKVPLKNKKWFKMCIMGTQKVMTWIMYAAVVGIGLFVAALLYKGCEWLYTHTNWGHVGFITLQILKWGSLVLVLAGCGIGLGWYIKTKVEKYEKSKKTPWEFYVFVKPFHLLWLGILNFILIPIYKFIILPIYRFLILPIYKWIIIPIGICIIWLTYKPSKWFLRSLKQGFINTFTIFIEMFKAAYSDSCPTMEWETPEERAQRKSKKK